MAPLFQYLHYYKKAIFGCLILSVLFASSFIGFASSDVESQQPQIPTAQIYLTRRLLLEKAVKDDDEEEIAINIISPKKNKVQKSHIDDEEGLSIPKKKKKLSSSIEEEVGDKDDELLSKKKKKKLSSLDQDEEKITKTKKKPSSSIENEGDGDGDGEFLTKKKKKKIVSDDDEDETTPKKKKTKSSNDDEDTLSLPKKKKVKSSDEEEEAISLSKKKKASSSSSDTNTKLISPKTTSSKNQTKLNSSTKNQTKLIKPIVSSSSSKNKTKLTKPTSSTSKHVLDDTKSKTKKSNSTSTKNSSPDLLKTQTNKSDTKKQVNQQTKSKPTKQAQAQTQALEEDDDFIWELRDLPSKFHQTFVPDLQRISTTSRVYLSKASKEFTKGFKPYVGPKYAASVATAISFAFFVVPLLLVSLLFNRIKAYFSLQRLLVFIQMYLSIYFSILCVSALITGLEPLKFFYATSRSTYIWLQLLQTLGYALFLLLLLMYSVLVFSTESGLAHKLLGLGQTFVGFAVGLHYYMTVFHRVVLRQPPKTNWKVHGIYAACFLLICLFAQADKRKKAYLEEGGQEGKQN